MTYNAIGLMSGSSLDGLDIAFVQFSETAGKWEYEIKCAACVAYDKELAGKLKEATTFSALDYQLLHCDYGHFIGQTVNEFIDQFQLNHKVNLICSHGHTTFHFPGKKMTHQLGDGAAIAAVTRLPVVSDLRSLDVAFGGQGAPIVPLGERLLFPDYHFFLNIGGIANVSFDSSFLPDFSEESGIPDLTGPAGLKTIAFDICAANRVLNMLAAQKGMAYDEDGKMASSGRIDTKLLEKLNALEYYLLPAPKSLANHFGTDLVFPLIESFGLNTEDALCTYVEHIAIQIKKSLLPLFSRSEVRELMVTGGGAFNQYLMARISAQLAEINFEIYLPESDLITYKEALIMALLGVLRWREQNTVLASVTGAMNDSIGGALWLGTEA